jgi:hypothetical protein
MKFNIYGRFVLEVIRENGNWKAYRVGDGTRRRERDLGIPSELEPGELAGFLDDVYHELAEPGRQIRQLD